MKRRKVATTIGDVEGYVGRIVVGVVFVSDSAYRVTNASEDTADMNSNVPLSFLVCERRSIRAPSGLRSPSNPIHALLTLLLRTWQCSIACWQPNFDERSTTAANGSSNGLFEALL